MARERQVTLKVPASWQGTLKFILTKAAQDYRKAVTEMPDAGAETHAAWKENAKQCAAAAAQLKKVNEG